MKSSILNFIQFNQNYLKIFELLTMTKRKHDIWIEILIWLIFWLGLVNSSWSSSVKVTSTVQHEEGKYSNFDITSSFKIQVGAVSNWLYILDYMYYLNTINMSIRKLNPNDTSVWLTSYANQPSLKSLAVDSKETNVYAVPYLLKATVLKLNATSGGLIRADEM